MNDRDRLEHLHLLLARVQRLPQSPQRDWMLSQVRARTVDVESGVRPAPMRPLAPEFETLPPPEPVTRRHHARPARRAVAPPAARAAAVHRARNVPAAPRAVESATSVTATVRERRNDDRVDLLAEGALLWLDEEPDGGGSSVPWARGLRG